MYTDMNIKRLTYLLLLLPIFLHGQTIPIMLFPYTSTVSEDVPEEIEYLAYYKFNGDLTDEGGTYNGTATGTITYQGDTALIFSTSDGNDYVNIGDLIPASTNAISIAYEVFLNEGNQNENYYVHSNTASPSGAVGVSSFFDGTGSGTFNANHRATDMTGSYNSDIASTVNSGCHSTMEDDTWYSVVEIWTNLDDDAETGNIYVVTYLDATCCQCSGASPDSVAYEQAPGTYEGQDWVLGCYRNAGVSTGFREGALLDEVKFFVGDIRVTEGLSYIDSLHNNPYRMPYQ